jgi:hypothetical protein
VKSVSNQAERIDVLWHPATSKATTSNPHVERKRITGPLLDPVETPRDRAPPAGGANARLRHELYRTPAVCAPRMAGTTMAGANRQSGAGPKYNRQPTSLWPAVVVVHGARAAIPPAATRPARRPRSRNFEHHPGEPPVPSTHAPTRQELYVVLALALCGVFWLFMPAVAQPTSYHAFADERPWLGIPNAVDVLSNLAFVAVGLLGLFRLQQGSRPLVPVMRLSLKVFFLGLLLTGFGSAYYHWEPTNDTLVLDRLPMTVLFAGVFGGALAERVSARSGLAVLVLMLVVGPVSVLYWKVTGDVSLYAVIQFGGIAAILLLLSFTRGGQDALPWWALLAWYGAAKVAEAGDVFVWNATREVFAGHALKHLAAAAGGLAIANALRRPVSTARTRADSVTG